MRRIVTLAIVLAVAVPLSVSASGLSWPSPAESVHAAIIAAALAQKSVHWTEFDPMCSVRWTSDVTADSGTQRVTTGCGGSKGEVQIVLIDDVAYVRGNPAGLESEYTLYLTEAQAKSYAGRWIAIPKGQRFYARMAGGLTLASIVHAVDPQGNGYELKVIRKKSREARLVVLEAGDPWDGGATLSAQARGDPLPVAFTGWGCPECVYTGSFSRWNEAVHVRAPARSAPIATVCGRCSRIWPVHG